MFCSCVFIIANTHTLTLYVYIILCSVENKYSDTQIKIRLHDIGWLVYLRESKKMKCYLIFKVL